MFLWRVFCGYCMRHICACFFCRYSDKHTGLSLHYRLNNSPRQRWCHLWRGVGVIANVAIYFCRGELIMESANDVFAQMIKKSCHLRACFFVILVAPPVILVLDTGIHHSHFIAIANANKVILSYYLAINKSKALSMINTAPAPPIYHFIVLLIEV